MINEANIKALLLIDARRSDFQSSVAKNAWRSSTELCTIPDDIMQTLYYPSNSSLLFHVSVFRGGHRIPDESCATSRFPG